MALSLALAGLMIHETAVAGGRFLAVGLRPQNGQLAIVVVSRTTPGAASSILTTITADPNGQPIPGPVYFKMERAADLKTITVWYSLTQVGWILIGTYTNAMAAAVHYGPFNTSTAAGIDILSTIEQLALSNASRLSTTVSTTQASVAIALQAADAVGNLSAITSTVQGVPKIITQTGGAYVWTPGIRVRTGHYAGWDSLAQITADLNPIIAADKNFAIKGICVSPTLAQLLGPAKGQYDGNGNSENGFPKVQGLINLVKSYNPPRDLTIEVNCMGNGYQAQTTNNYLSSFAPAYMNTSTYDFGEAHKLNDGTAETPRLKIWNMNVALDLIQCIKDYMLHFGKDTPTGGIYRWEPFQEISIIEGQGGYSPSALLSTWPTLMQGIRAACPNTLVFCKPTFINPNNGASYPALVSAMFNNNISMGQEDTTPSSLDWGGKAYLGQWPGVMTTDYTKNLGGNPGWDFHCNIDPAELFHDRTGANTTGATAGTGLLYDVWQRVISMKASHVDIYATAYLGPNNIRSVWSSSAPANPPNSPGAGLSGTAAKHPLLQDVLTGNTDYPGVLAQGCAIPWIAYPATYPK